MHPLIQIYLKIVVANQANLFARMYYVTLVVFSTQVSSEYLSVNNENAI